VAALAVLDTIVAEGLIERGAALGTRLADGILAAGAPVVRGVRGSGLWRAIEFDAPVAAAFEVAARDAGFLVNAVTADAVRLAPPLIVSAAELDCFVAALPGIAARSAEGTRSAGGIL
jgi:acetylornithine aminotransferase